MECHQAPGSAQHDPDETPDGGIVWSLVMKSNNKTAAIVASAERLVPGYVSLQNWAHT
jgi:hypothetical protein